MIKQPDFDNALSALRRYAAGIHLNRLLFDPVRHSPQPKKSGT